MTEILRKPEAEILHELFPAFRDGLSLRIGLAERPVVRGLAHAYPLVAHIVEASSPGSVVVEVRDQLAENPFLVGVRDAPITALHNRFGDDAPP